MEQQLLAPPPEPARVSWAQDLLDRAIVFLAAFSGLATENMTRGHGWRFLDIGRRLERAWQVIELVRRGMLELPAIPIDAHVSAEEAGSALVDSELSVLLEIADSTLTYRSRYLTSMQSDLVLDLLLLDEGNPRSAAFQIACLRDHIDQLPESHPAGGHSKEARLVLSMLTSLQTAEASELTSPRELSDFTMRLSADLNQLSEILTRVYFAHAAAPRQMAPR
jgi:uncharacterized alpha-E superfamily protein